MKEIKMQEQLKLMIEEFQCPGCVAGMNVECGACFVEEDKSGESCKGHVLGTHLGLGNPIALGLPKGFHKPGHYWESDKKRWWHHNQMNIRLWFEGPPKWDKLNVPVWAMEKDGYLFVRTYAPRINMAWVDVVKGGTMAMVPNAINVGEFIDEID